MLEPRPYRPSELLAWCRLLAQALGGLGLAYAREREGDVEDFVAFARERLAGLGGGVGVEDAALSLLLSVEAIGGEVRSRALTPESAEIVAADLPGEALVRDLDEELDLAVAADDLLALVGVDQVDLNRLYDILGGAAAGEGVEYLRQAEPDGQHLTLRAW